MGTNGHNLITVIDIGSAKTAVILGEVAEGGLKYRGHGTAESRGTRKGAIVDLEKAAAAVHHAVERAELVSGATIANAIVTVGGTLVRGVNSRGGLTLGSRPRDVTRDDVRQAIERARSVAIPADREMLHLLPQEYIVDQQGAIRDPLGMTGAKLEVNLHIVTASSSQSQSVVTAANKAGVSADDTVFEALAAAEATLRPDERELGVCLIDIGAGSSELIVYFEGSVAHTGVVPIGGDHFTNDVAVGLRTPLSEAEKIKKNFGHAVVTQVPEGREIEVPGVGDRASRLMPQRLLAEILEPRASELFEYVSDNLRSGGVQDALGAGIVLTGGGSRLPGLLTVAEALLNVPARLASPTPLSKLPASLAEPEYATALGALHYAYRARVARRVPEENSFRARMRTLLERVSVL
ncbi:MAG: cell division protein FtsA [Acidobacteriales bacterium]|nr:cell division protein FtsA [Terriglobales bacterium]